MKLFSWPRAKNNFSYNTKIMFATRIMAGWRRKKSRLFCKPTQQTKDGGHGVLVSLEGACKYNLNRPEVQKWG
jgi:hypothetical protein